MSEQNFDNKLKEIVDVLMKVGQGNFNVQISTSPNNSLLDAIIVGINMMIDDLHSLTDLKKQMQYITHLNEELNQSQEKIKKQNEELNRYKAHLEEIVSERTRELDLKNLELSRYNKLFEGREFRIKELRDRVKELEKKLQNG